MPNCPCNGTVHTNDKLCQAHMADSVARSTPPPQALYTSLRVGRAVLHGCPATYSLTSLSFSFGKKGLQTAPTPEGNHED